MRKKIAVFASGYGSNLQALIDFNQEDDLNADIALVFSNNAHAFALKRAKKHNIKTVHIDPAGHAERQEFEREVLEVLEEEGIDLIVLAGYMLLLTPLMVNAYKGRILNIHPALLPAFRGTRGIRDAFQYGVKISGVTVHFVDEKLDNGPIIMQAPVYIENHDTLESFEEKIHKVEHKIYPLAVKQYCLGKIRVQGRKAKIL